MMIYKGLICQISDFPSSSLRTNLMSNPCLVFAEARCWTKPRTLLMHRMARNTFLVVWWAISQKTQSLNPFWSLWKFSFSWLANIFPEVVSLSVGTTDAGPAFCTSWILKKGGWMQESFCIVAATVKARHSPICHKKDQCYMAHFHWWHSPDTGKGT